MTVNSKKKYFIIKKGLWKGFSLWDLYKRAHTPYKWHRELFNYGKKIEARGLIEFIRAVAVFGWPRVPRAFRKLPE